MSETPKFMDNTVPTEEPKLDPSTIVVGSTVLLVRPARYRTPTPPVPIKVVSRGRVWIEVSGLGERVYRLRLDTQTDGTGSFYAVHFRTQAQQDFYEAETSAWRYLKDQGIRLDVDSAWDTSARRIELARLIWTANNPPTDPVVPFTVHHLDGTSTTHGAVRRDCAFCHRERSANDDNHSPQCPYWSVGPGSR